MKLKLQEFKISELVIIDRLHGMIFSVITGTSCIAIDSCNYKIKSNYKWFEKIDYIKYAGSLENVEQYAEDLINKNNIEENNNKIFELYFNELFKVIDKII